MKITHTPKQPSTDALASVGKHKKASVAGYAQSNSAGSASNVDLSTTAKQLQSSEYDINVERVQAIKDAIASGQLQIDTSRIADSLIASTQELLK